MLIVWNPEICNQTVLIFISAWLSSIWWRAPDEKISTDKSALKIYWLVRNSDSRIMISSRLLVFKVFCDLLWFAIKWWRDTRVVWIRGPHPKFGSPGASNNITLIIHRAKVQPRYWETIKRAEVYQRRSLTGEVSLVYLGRKQHIHHYFTHYQSEKLFNHVIIDQSLGNILFLFLLL